MAVGTAVLNFGTAANRTVDASVAVTGQAGILADSHVEAFLQGDNDADHSPDEHIMLGDMLKLVCSDIVAGTGFTIYGIFDDRCGLNGSLTVHWVWA